MADRDTAQNQETHEQEWYAHAPKVADAFRKGIPVLVTTWGGREVSGLVCDREQAGLLLDIRGLETESLGYIFLPWSSVEQVEIREVAPRRIKSLPG
ncbi:MAG: hypothetical protein ACR2GU_00020 [Rubrobacteraceae bacterium]